MNMTEAITTKFTLLAPALDEHTRRLWAAAEALALGHGGQSLVAAATGLSRDTIRAGQRELLGASGPGPGRIRRAGGGRKKTVITDPTLLDDLVSLVEPTSRGDPESPLRWTLKSVPTLTAELRARGHVTSTRM